MITSIEFRSPGKDKTAKQYGLSNPSPWLNEKDFSRVGKHARNKFWCSGWENDGDGGRRVEKGGWKEIYQNAISFPVQRFPSL